MAGGLALASQPPAHGATLFCLMQIAGKLTGTTMISSAQSHHLSSLPRKLASSKYLAENEGRTGQTGLLTLHCRTYVVPWT